MTLVLSPPPRLLQKLSGLPLPPGWREKAAVGRPGEGLPRLPHSTSLLCSTGPAPELWGGRTDNLTLGTEWTLAPTVLKWAAL